MIVGISKLDASFKIHCDTTYQRKGSNNALL
jgi:hypothetical protein